MKNKHKFFKDVPLGKKQFHVTESIKQNADGVIDTFKVRLIIKGFFQQKKR